MDPEIRRWWRLLDDLPDQVRQVERWIEAPPMPLDGDGHLHANPTSVVCLSGVVRVETAGRRVDLLPGNVLLIAPGVWHRHAPLRRGSLWFGQGFLPAFSDIRIESDTRCWTGRLPSQPSRSLMDAALGCAVDDERRRRFLALLDQVLRETVVDLHFDEEPLRRMIDRLWRDLHRGLTVAELLSASGLRRSRAYVVFTDGFGVTPKVAIETDRLGLARGLLDAGVPVAEVARRSGYASDASFRRAWRRVHGGPPRGAIAG